MELRKKVRQKNDFLGKLATEAQWDSESSARQKIRILEDTWYVTTIVSSDFLYFFYRMHVFVSMLNILKNFFYNRFFFFNDRTGLKRYDL